MLFLFSFLIIMNEFGDAEIDDLKIKNLIVN